MLIPALAILALSPADPSPLLRRYEVGEHFRYRITQTETRNGQTSHLEATTEHDVVALGAGFAEQVRWVSIHSAGIDRSAEAAAIPAYTLSLEAGQGLESPRPSGAVDLVGLTTDLQTFYVAVSPALGIAHLVAPGDSFTRPELIVGDFADGAAILSGRDCTMATLTLQSLDPETGAAVIETRFQPPTSSCLPAAAAGGDGMPDNFQMVRKVGDQFLDLHGRESFVIVTTLEGRSGRIVTAEMVNTLELSGRSCADAALTRCAAIPAVKRERLVSLALEAGETAD